MLVRDLIKLLTNYPMSAEVRAVNYNSSSADVDEGYEIEVADKTPILDDDTVVLLYLGPTTESSDDSDSDNVDETDASESEI